MKRLVLALLLVSVLPFTAVAKDVFKNLPGVKDPAVKEEVEIDKIDKKLSNEQFVAKAKPEVIEEQRTRRADAVARRERLEAALTRLS